MLLRGRSPSRTPTSATTGATSGSQAGAVGPRRLAVQLASLLIDDPDLAQRTAADACVRVEARLAPGARPQPGAVRRAVVRQARRHRRRARRAGSGLGGPDPGAGEGRSGSDALFEAVRRLPFPQRAAVVLRCFEGLDDDEVAEALGVAASTARARCERGLDRVERLVPDPAAARRDDGARERADDGQEGAR